MPNKTRGVGLFTAENIVAAIRAIPESDGTYRDVARKAEQYGGNFHHQTIANWIRHGRADMEAGQPSTAYARFTKRYQDLIDEHCGPDNNRNREFDRALEILERTCECDNRCSCPTGNWPNSAASARRSRNRAGSSVVPDEVAKPAQPARSHHQIDDSQPLRHRHRRK